MILVSLGSPKAVPPSVTTPRRGSVARGTLRPRAAVPRYGVLLGSKPIGGFLVSTRLCRRDLLHDLVLRRLEAGTAHGGDIVGEQPLRLSRRRLLERQPGRVGAVLFGLEPVEPAIRRGSAGSWIAQHLEEPAPRPR